MALDWGAEWVFWLDDDLTFRTDTLMRLLRHDVPVVVGLSVQRHADFEPLWLHTNVSAASAFYPQPPVPSRADGLVPLAACTSGGMLTRRDALEAVGGPYWWTLGKHGAPDQWCDDLDFCRQLTEAGVPIYGDPSVRLGHISHIELWPHQMPDGQWVTVIRDRSGNVITYRPMPQARAAVSA
jgi:GT2 family glycosyltransferase